MTSREWHELYWPMRAALEKSTGPKLPFKSIRNLLWQIRETYELRIPRDAWRTKNGAISWMCQHSDICREFLDMPIEPGHVMEGDMHRVQEAWDEAPEMEDRLSQVFGRKPKMSECVAFARDLARRHNLRVDRQATRRRPVLLAWFVENWDMIKDDFVVVQDSRSHSDNTDGDEANDIGMDEECCEIDAFSFGSVDDEWELDAEWNEPQFFM